MGVITKNHYANHLYQLSSYRCGGDESIIDMGNFTPYIAGVVFPFRLRGMVPVFFEAHLRF